MEVTGVVNFNTLTNEELYSIDGGGILATIGTACVVAAKFTGGVVLAAGVVAGTAVVVGLAVVGTAYVVNEIAKSF